MTQDWEKWWEKLLIKIQNQESCTEDEVYKAWNFLWAEWKGIEKSFLSHKFLPEKLRMLLSLRSIDLFSVLIAPTFLTSIFAKGITPEEMNGFIKSFRSNHWFDGFQDKASISDSLIYTNGFGGDDVKTINVSTPSMIMAGASGAKVLKMGSHSYFGTSGAENFTDSIGYRSLTKPEEVLQAFNESKSAFIGGESAADQKTQDIAGFMSQVPKGRRIMKALFYPFRYHILCFNFFQAPYQQRGISLDRTELVADLLTATMTGIQKGMVVYGCDQRGLSLDEVSNVGPTKITFIEKDKKTETIVTTPEDWGVKQCKTEEIIPQQGESTLQIILEVFAGKREDAYTDLLCVNAAQHLFLNGMVKNFKQGTAMVKQALSEGKVLDELRRFIHSSTGDPSKIERELERLQ